MNLNSKIESESENRSVPKAESSGVYLNFSIAIKTFKTMKLF